MWGLVDRFGAAGGVTHAPLGAATSRRIVGRCLRIPRGAIGLAEFAGSAKQSNAPSLDGPGRIRIRRAVDGLGCQPLAGCWSGQPRLAMACRQFGFGCFAPCPGAFVRSACVFARSRAGSDSGRTGLDHRTQSLELVGAAPIEGATKPRCG